MYVCVSVWLRMRVYLKTMRITSVWPRHTHTHKVSEKGINLPCFDGITKLLCKRIIPIQLALHKMHSHLPQKVLATLRCILFLASHIRSFLDGNWRWNSLSICRFHMLSSSSPSASYSPSPSISSFSFIFFVRILRMSASLSTSSIAVQAARSLILYEKILRSSASVSFFSRRFCFALLFRRECK